MTQAEGSRPRRDATWTAPRGLDTGLLDALLETIRPIVRDVVAARAPEIDRTKQFPEDIRRLFSDLGLLGLSVPEEYGGTPIALEGVVDVIALVAATCASSANIITQQALAIGPILQAGSEEQKRRWLPDLAAGRKLAAFALTEPDAGSDNRGLRTMAIPDGDGYRLHGGKIFCTWGSIADVVTVFARLGERTGEFIALVVEPPVDGFIIERIEDKMGMNGSPTANIRLDGARVAAGNVLGRAGDGLRIALSSLNPGRVQIGALALGISVGALEYASRYLEERHQFGVPLSSFQGLRFRIADHATHIEASRLLLRRAARAVDAGTDDAVRLSAMAKLMATDVAMAVTTDAVGFLGGYGYMREFPVERMMRDAKVQQIVEGTNEIQRVVIAREWFRELQVHRG